MALPFAPPLPPQLARASRSLPEGPEWAYEPKWDGFRMIAFVDGEEVTLQSRGGKAMGRYFPELAFPAGRYIIDGEVVVRGPDGREDFDMLGQRIHPAASRVRLLAESTPARFLAFDLLALEDEDWRERPFAERRQRLEGLVAEPVELTPCTRDRAAAERWLVEAEGVIAKRLDAPYLAGERQGMVKVRRVRTIDCVVVGWRPGKAEGTVGAIILGLYDLAGELAVVGHSSGFTAAEKRALRDRLGPYETGQRGAGEPSRWSGDRDLEWVELRPELVVEVTFDHVSGRRIRHGAQVTRWRDDKAPRDCTIDQLAA